MQHDPELWRRADVALEQLLDLPEDRREQAMNDLALEPAVRALVARLLDADRIARGVLDHPLETALGAGLAASELSGRRFGAYVLDAEIGRGGMAVVYAARRADGGFEQEVAVKILAAGLLPTALAARFRAEQQVLARLRHPNIAAMLDGGVADDGTPYLVMERIDGDPIDRHCDQRKTSIEQRITLFLQTCAAVAEAHRKLIVHSDIKPSNVLVTADHQVKLLDFGIAKLLDPAGDVGSVTGTGARPMTPEYAAPEQLRGGDVTVATDVYALGVLLYVLLTGRRPYSLDGLGAAEVERVVCEREPPAPSTAAVSLLTRGTDAKLSLPRTLQRQLRGDLDAIVLKALAKDPRRRYASVSELAADLGRYLDGRPVEARRPTFAYHAGRALRRHRHAIAAAATVVLMLVGVVAFYTYRLRFEHAQAQLEAQRAREMSALLLGLFRSANPREAAGSPAAVSTFLERGANRARAMRSQPLVQAELLGMIATAYQGLGELAPAERLFEEALALLRGHRAPAEQLVAGINRLAWVKLSRGVYAESRALFADALARHADGALPQHVEYARALHGLALARLDLGDRAASERLLVQALERLRALTGNRHAHVADALHDLALVQRLRGDRSRARRTIEECIALRRDLLGPRHPLVGDGVKLLAKLAHDDGDASTAQALAEEALTIHRHGLGDDHVHVAEDLRLLAELARERGDDVEALSLVARALAIQQHALGDAHPATVASLALWTEISRSVDP